MNRFKFKQQPSSHSHSQSRSPGASPQLSPSQSGGGESGGWLTPKGGSSKQMLSRDLSDESGTEGEDGKACYGQQVCAYLPIY